MQPTPSLFHASPSVVIGAGALASAVVQARTPRLGVDLAVGAAGGDRPRLG